MVKYLKREITEKEDISLFVNCLRVMMQLDPLKIGTKRVITRGKDESKVKDTV